MSTRPAQPTRPIATNAPTSTKVANSTTRAILPVKDRTKLFDQSTTNITSFRTTLQRNSIPHEHLILASFYCQKIHKHFVKLRASKTANNTRDQNYYTEKIVNLISTIQITLIGYYILSARKLSAQIRTHAHLITKESVDDLKALEDTYKQSEKVYEQEAKQTQERLLFEELLTFVNKYTTRSANNDAISGLITNIKNSLQQEEYRRSSLELQQKQLLSLFTVGQTVVNTMEGNILHNTAVSTSTNTNTNNTSQVSKNSTDSSNNPGENDNDSPAENMVDNGYDGALDMLYKRSVKLYQVPDEQIIAQIQVLLANEDDNESVTYNTMQDSLKDETINSNLSDTDDIVIYENPITMVDNDEPIPITPATDDETATILASKAIVTSTSTDTSQSNPFTSRSSPFRPPQRDLREKFDLDTKLTRKISQLSAITTKKYHPSQNDNKITNPDVNDIITAEDAFAACPF